ncbi:hypothetical protein HPB48_011428 [Haemaphysalis longicornis]|uniref:C2H2-type domain-containing protein n=1 Tax=Haemaphysalis longicornis TaxID=44386 RepID=A0A9J6FY56_HAELO|nr:hypothetical protein HPB48_011428 [Haemaphysalis longicornis]
MESEQPTNSLGLGDDEEHACIFCERTFPTAERLVVHAKVHREDGRERPFKCTECCRVFPRVDKLRAHQLVHREGKIHRCHLCPQAFTYRQALLEHMLRHEGVRNLQCHLCPKAFYFRTDLQSHVRRHTNERLHRCRSCPKAFVGRSDLLRHERSHDGDRPYRCTECGRCFGRNASLTRHMRRHTGQRPFECHLCPNTFTRAYLLEAHLKDHPRPLFDLEPAPDRKNSGTHRWLKGQLKANTAPSSTDSTVDHQEVPGPPGTLATMSDSLPRVKPDPELLDACWSPSSQPTPHCDRSSEVKPTVKKEALFISSETESSGRQVMAMQQQLPLSQQKPFGRPCLVSPPQREGLREVKPDPEAAHKSSSSRNLPSHTDEGLCSVKREELLGLAFPFSLRNDIPRWRTAGSCG